MKSSICSLSIVACMWASILPAQDGPQGGFEYAPTRLQWIAAMANAAQPSNSWEEFGYTLIYTSGAPGTNALVVRPSSDPKRADEQAMQRELASAKRNIRAFAEKQGWDWLEIHEENAPKPDGKTDGDTAYSPTRLEWISLMANAALSKDARTSGGYGVFFRTGPQGSNTLYMVGYKGSGADEAALNQVMETARREIVRWAKEKGWDEWLKITSPDLVEATDLEPSHGDKTYFPTRLEWMTMLANATLARDSWKTQGFKTQFKIVPNVPNTIEILADYDQGRVAKDALKREVQFGQMMLFAGARNLGWTWLKARTPNITFTSPVSSTRPNTGAVPTVNLPDFVRPAKAIESSGTQAQRFQEIVATASPDALEAFQAGDTEACMSHLRAAVAQDPRLPPPRLTLASFYLAAGQSAAARSLLEEIAARDIKRPDMYVAFGQLAMAEGHLTDAEVHFEKAEALTTTDSANKPQAVRILFNIIEGRLAIAEKRGNWGKAQDLLAQWVKAQPGDARLRHRWANALMMTGRESDAFDQFDIAYRQDNQLSPGELSIAAAHLGQGDFRKANRWYAKALQAYPEESKVHYEWASALLLQDRGVEAEAAAVKAIELGMNSPEIHLKRGMIARQRHDWNAARGFLTSVLKEDRDNEEAFAELILSLAEADEKSQELALNLVQERGARTADASLTLAALGWVYHRSQQDEKAEELMRQAVSQPQSNVEALFLWGRFLTDRGNKTEARKVAKLLQQVIDEPILFVSRPDARKWLIEVSSN